MAKTRIVVHGGAGHTPKISDHCMKAAKVGDSILKRGGSALDAVIRAVVYLEDDPVFNAGTGSRLRIDGNAEMDAAVMTSEGRCGAVAGIKMVKNPILVARKVMEDTPHVLLVGQGAVVFARKFGFRSYNPATPEAKRDILLALKAA